MDKIFKSAIILGILVVSLSVAYYFVFRPYKKDYNFNRCLISAEDTLSEKKQEINSKINDLENEKGTISREVDNSLADFLKNNPEPKETATSFADKYRKDPSTGLLLDPHRQWEENRNNIFEPVRKIESEIGDLKNDILTIETEKSLSDADCYKRY